MKNKQFKFCSKKNIIFLSLISVIIIAFIYFIFQPKKIIEINSDNFQEYFIITQNISDFSVDEGYNSFLGGKLYTGYATINIIIKPKKNIVIDNVKIKGQITLNGYYWTGNTINYEIEVDKEGYGEYLRNIQTKQSILRPEMPSILEFKINEANGTIKK